MAGAAQIPGVSRSPDAKPAARYVRTVTCSPVLADALYTLQCLVLFYVHLPSSCWSSCSPGQTFPGVLSDIQHRLSGTRCHKLFWSATLSIFKSILKKLSCSVRLSLNTDPTCRQRLWSYECIAVVGHWLLIIDLGMTHFCHAFGRHLNNSGAVTTATPQVDEKARILTPYRIKTLEFIAYNLAQLITTLSDLIRPEC